jgi:hypothetical protein
MTSYQRQKQKIKELENQVSQLQDEINALVMFPNSQDAQMVVMKVRMIYGTNQFIWTGTGEAPTIQGIMNMIKKS